MICMLEGLDWIGFDWMRGFWFGEERGRRIRWDRMGWGVCVCVCSVVCAGRGWFMYEGCAWGEDDDLC